MRRIIDRLKRTDFKRMYRMIKVISKRANKSFLYIFFDVLKCYKKFGAGYMDYYLFYFEDLSDEIRATYITTNVNRDYVRTCNDSSYYHILHNKTEFLDKYKEFVKRDTLNLEKASFDEFKDFVNKHPVFMGKPIDGMCGIGVEVIDTTDKKIEDVYNSLIKNNQKLLEEKIIQNEEVSSIYPYAINTIRIVTLNRNDKVTIMFRAIRIGNHGKCVDNFNNGGMFTVIDEDGAIRKPAIDKENVIYEKHPMTNTGIVGFKIPHFDEVIALAKKLALVTPQIGFSAWDIAITDKGVDIVEGNEHPGYDIYQSLPHLDAQKHGLKPIFDKAIYGND